jgi:KAP family P-loop domain
MQIRSSALDIPTDDPFKNDCLSRKALEPPLTQFVTQSIGSFVLAIDGSWGSGKTTFLNMWQAKLNEAGHLCFYLNAWQSDFVEDPLVAVVGELSIAIEANDLMAKDNVRKTIDKIEKRAKSIVKKLIPMGAKIATFGAVNIDPAIERELSAAAGIVAENLIQDYENEKTNIKAFRDDLKFLAKEIQGTSEETVKIVIIIDELDRCRPTYAVQLLERIKHLFDVEGIVFVLGIDRSQLSHSIKALYGSEFDAAGYLKRFIDLDYRLPEPVLGCYCSSLFTSFGIDTLILRRKSQDPYYEVEDLKHCLGYLMSAARMSLRDQEQIVSRLRVVLQTIPINHILYPATLSILLFLREFDRNIYTSVMRGSLTYKEFLVFIEGLPNEAQAFQEFSKMRSNGHYGGFFKERIEAVFLSGLKEILNNIPPELQEYINRLNSGQDPSYGTRHIVETARQGAGLTMTDSRLNLTSNFV